MSKTVGKRKLRNPKRIKRRESTPALQRGDGHMGVCRCFRVTKLKFYSFGGVEGACLQVQLELTIKEHRIWYSFKIYMLYCNTLRVAPPAHVEARYRRAYV